MHQDGFTVGSTGIPPLEIIEQSPPFPVVPGSSGVLCVVKKEGFCGTGRRSPGELAP